MYSLSFTIINIIIVISPPSFKITKVIINKGYEIVQFPFKRAINTSLFQFNLEIIIN